MQKVESRLKGGLSAIQQGEQARLSLEDVDRPVGLSPKKPRRAIDGEKRQAPASQVKVINPDLLSGLLAWLRLPLARGDPAQMGNVISSQHGAKCAPCHEEVR